MGPHAPEVPRQSTAGQSGRVGGCRTLSGASANCAGAARPKVTQEDLAGRLAALGLVIDRSAVSRIENQERILTDIEVIAIARALRLPVGEFFSEPKTYPFPLDRDLRVAEPGDRT